MIDEVSYRLVQSVVTNTRYSMYLTLDFCLLTSALCLVTCGNERKSIRAQANTLRVFAQSQLKRIPGSHQEIWFFF